jgi:hypothetical protein
MEREKDCSEEHGESSLPRKDWKKPEECLRGQDGRIVWWTMNGTFGRKEGNVKLGSVCMLLTFDLLFGGFLLLPPTLLLVEGIGGLAGEPSSVPSAESPRSPVGVSQMWVAH